MHARVLLSSLALLLAASPSDRATTQSLGGPDRFITILETDKPIYRAGETIYVRGTTLHARTHAPLQNGWPLTEIKGPKGESIFASNSGLSEGTFAFQWKVPDGQPGGEYTLKTTWPNEGYAPAERKFDIRAYRPPRLKTQIVFARDGYGPGDTVSATLDVQRAEGGVPTTAKVTATARVDEAEVAKVSCTVDAKGLCAVKFDLPKTLTRGDGVLSFAVEDGGVVETASKTIPILLQTLDLAFYPEGGELVGGVANRLYVEAKTPAKKPADLEADVVDEKTGTVLGHLRTEHEGRGKVEITPKPGVQYVLKVSKPSGISRTFPLPKVLGTGVTLSSLDDVTAADKPVRLQVRWGDSKPTHVTLSLREEVLSDVKLDGKGSATVSLDAKNAAGVLVATVWGQNDAPLAERLVFRRADKALSLSFKTEPSSMVPGGKAKVTVKATRDGKPVSAMLGVTVTDDSIRQMVDKREQSPTFLPGVWLEPEVQELADAHVYLDEKNPKSAVATDLLLGTQGWRRFAFVQLAPFLTAHGDDARRVLALRLQTVVDRPDDDMMLAEGGGGMPGRGRMMNMVPAARPQPMPPPAPVKAEPARPNAVVAKPMPIAPARPPVVVAQPPRDQQQGKLDEALQANEKKKEAWAGDEKRAARRERVAMPQFVRIYAHQVRPDRQPNDRIDFAETLYWNAGLKTNEQGEASFEFGLSDAVTTFRVAAGGFTKDGVLGEGAHEFKSVQPFYLEPKMPLEVTQGDVVRLPVAVVNGTNEPLNGVSLQLSAPGDIRITNVGPMNLTANQRGRGVVEMTIGQGTKSAPLTLVAKAGSYQDTVTKPLAIKPLGFPQSASFGGMLEKNSKVSHVVTVPAELVRGSVTAAVSVYPTPLANMNDALKRLIREPYGCFEQTSSTSYPLTMAQQYFLSHTGVDPTMVADAKAKLDTSYNRLVSFQCSEKGYEWFGENPGHEALTAFGLLHFTDMKQVRQVDVAMLDNTRAWLLKQRDGKGGFERKRRALHTWVEDKDSSDAYITWALLESGEKPSALSAETNRVLEAGKSSKNAYVTALAANVALDAGNKAAATALLDKLASLQDAKTGAVGGGTQSIVGSTGESLEIEVTSLATLGWLKDSKYAGNVEKSVKYLAASCDGGRYGSTQSTVLALRAIVAYDKARAKPKAPGSLKVFVDGQSVGSAVAFDQNTRGTLTLPDISELITSGKHTVELQMVNGASMPYSVEIGWNALKPDSAPETKVAMEVRLNAAQVREGEIIEAVAKVTNVTKEQLPTVIAIVGLPGGLEPRHDQLKELKKKGTIDAYEVIGREVVLYWRGMTLSQSVEVPLSLLAAVPGTYTGPASRAYLYYSDEFKQWQPGLKVTVAAR